MEPSRTQRNFTCTHCSRAFRRLEHLQRHNRTHTNEKPFICRCGASFTRNDLLKRHSRIAHPLPSAHESTVSHVDAEALFPGTSGSLALSAFPAGHLDGAVIYEASVPGQDDPGRVKRALSLPVPPEYLHVEEAFCANNGGNAVHDMLQDLLGDSKPPANHPTWDQSVAVASTDDSSASFHQAPSEPEVRAELHTKHGPPDGIGRASGPGCAAGIRSKLVQSLLLHGRTAEPVPSEQSLSRYIQAFFDGFHRRYSMLHTQTKPLSCLPADLMFALLAIGADSCLETKAALYLFESAVAVSDVGLVPRQSDPHLTSASHDVLSTAAPATPDASGENTWLDETSHALCVMTLLTSFALQNRSPAAMRAMWSVQGIFAEKLRQSLSPCDAQEDFTSDHRTAWSEWARRESQRRVRHAAFCALSLVSLTFDFPVAVALRQLNVALPCSAEEWDAPSLEEWLRIQRSTLSKPLLLSGIVEALLSSEGDARPPSSILGDFSILHAIVQRIRTLRQVLPMIPQDIHKNIEYVVTVMVVCPRLVDLTTALLSLFMVLSGNTLHRSSQASLTRAHSSPTYSRGLRVCTLAGVAYMELHLTIGQFPSPSQDATQVATWLQDLSLPAKSPQLLPALRCAAYALNEQVSIGFGMKDCLSDIGADPQGFLCLVRVSVFLTKWLLLIAGIVGEQTVTEEEHQIIRSAGDAVYEATLCIELRTLFNREDLLSIAIGVLEIVSHIFQGSHREHISVVGKAFELYATRLRTPAENPGFQANASHTTDTGVIC